MAKIRRIAIGRVFNWGQYENLRLLYEYEIEDGENEKEVMIKAFEELLEINECLQLYASVRAIFHELDSAIYPKKGPGKLDEYRDFIDNKIAEKAKTLACLEQIDLIPTACAEALGPNIEKAKEQRERLKKEIQELNERLKAIDEYEEEYKKFRGEYFERIKDVKHYIITGSYNLAKDILRELEEKIKEFGKKLHDLRPPGWW